MQLLQWVDRISNDRNPGSVGTRDIEGCKLLPKVRNSCPTNEVFLPQLLLFSENTFFFPFFDTLLLFSYSSSSSFSTSPPHSTKKETKDKQPILLPTQILLASGNGPRRNVFCLLLFNERERKRREKEREKTRMRGSN